MASPFSIQKPFVVASLPRPIDHSTGRYVVSEVHGGRPGSRKRKRAELAVGIDGEGLNLYDTQSSKLITSYALPPQSTFTCAACSVRLRKTGKGNLERRTYVSTRTATSQITLFQEFVTPDGPSISSTATYELQNSKNAVVFMTIVQDTGISNIDDLLLVRQDGEIQCLRGEDLKLKWISPATTISKDTELPDLVNHRVEFAMLTDGLATTKGLLKGRPDVFTAFPQAISQDGFNPELLVIITSPADPAVLFSRTLHVVAIPRRNVSATVGGIQSVQTLFTVSLPWAHEELPQAIGNLKYDLHVASGTLYELAHHTLTIHDLTEPTPKLKSRFVVGAATTFLRLNNTSIVASSDSDINVYNPLFQSVQASVTLDPASGLSAIAMQRTSNSNGVSSKTCELVAYSSKQSVVHAISGNDLIAFQIEAVTDATHRRRALGLLIDSLGCGIRDSTKGNTSEVRGLSLSSFGSYVLGSKADLDEERLAKILEMDKCVVEDDVAAFEAIMAIKLGMKLEISKTDSHDQTGELPQNGDSANVVNGTPVPINGKAGLKNAKASSEESVIPAWLWPKRRSDYLDVDHRWVSYALSKIFSWADDQSTGQLQSLSNGNGKRLVINFYPPNVVNWLLETGNLNKARIESVLRHSATESGPSAIPAGQLVRALMDVDPEMKTLFSLLSNTFLDAAELLHAIRLFMQSLELLEPATEQLLLTNGETHLLNTSEDVDAVIELEEKEAHAALQLAEYQLEDGSGIRGEALSLALSKLHSCPSGSVVRALQSTMTSSEIVHLIYLLRIEMARGAWTFRYFDTYQTDEINNETGTQGSTIVLLSDLLNSCVDAIGAGGWLSGEAMLVNGDHLESEDFIASFKLEISAALEGVEEATYLRGLTNEIVRYGEAIQNALPREKKRKGDSTDAGQLRKKRPITLAEEGRDQIVLPLGLKAEEKISRSYVGAGGEIFARTARGIGMLKSKKVGKYSLERIVI